MQLRNGNSPICMIGSRLSSSQILQLPSTRNRFSFHSSSTSFFYGKAISRSRSPSWYLSSMNFPNNSAFTILRISSFFSDLAGSRVSRTQIFRHLQWFFSRMCCKQYRYQIKQRFFDQHIVCHLKRLRRSFLSIWITYDLPYSWEGARPLFPSFFVS